MHARPLWLRPSLCLSLCLAGSLSACARTPPPVAPTLGAGDGAPAVDPKAAWVARAAPRRFGPGAEAPDGCFAWSASRASAACALGQWPHRRASQPRVVSFLAATGSEPTPLPLQLEGEDPSLAKEPGIVVLSRSRLDAAMRDGSFVELPAGAVIPGDGRPRAVGPFTITLRHALARRGEGDSTSTYVTSLVVRLARLAPSAPPLVDDTFGPIACASPTLKVFEVSSTALVIERGCHLVGEGLSDREVAAWVCDAAAGVCR